MGSLSCCNSASGKDRTDVSEPPSTGSTKDWFAAQLQAEEEDMACVHFDFKKSHPLGSPSAKFALDNIIRTSPSFFNVKAWSELQDAANNLTVSNPAFLKRMEYLRKKSYVYCCKDICPSVTAALGSALGRARHFCKYTPRHRTHLEPSFLELNAEEDVASNIWP